MGATTPSYRAALYNRDLIGRNRAEAWWSLEAEAPPRLTWSPQNVRRFAHQPCSATLASCQSLFQWPSDWPPSIPHNLHKFCTQFAQLTICVSREN